MRIGSSALALAFGTLGLLSSGTDARADVQHVIGKGHTIQAIANRYHVPAKAIIEANHLKDVKHLKIGDVLTVPKAETPGTSGTSGAPGASGGIAKKAGAEGDKPGHGADKDKDARKDAVKGKSGKDAAKPEAFDARAKTPGVIHLKRLGTSEEADLRVTDKGTNKVSATTLKSMEKMLRAQSGQSHPIEGRLISLLGVVSNHFGSRKIEVVSGFRPYTPTQYTPHSNHNHGKAVDFRVVGVPNETVRDFCRTLRNTGCGYYPNSTFVHMDVRDQSAFWIDFSKPGEAPRYNAPNLDADEGTSDVHGDSHPSVNTAPPPAPAEEPVPGNAATSESDPPPATKPDGE